MSTATKMLFFTLKNKKQYLQATGIFHWLFAQKTVKKRK